MEGGGGRQWQTKIARSTKREFIISLLSSSSSYSSSSRRDSLYLCSGRFLYEKDERSTTTITFHEIIEFVVISSGMEQIML